MTELERASVAKEMNHAANGVVRAAEIVEIPGSGTRIFAAKVHDRFSTRLVLLYLYEDGRTLPRILQ